MNKVEYINTTFNREGFRLSEIQLQQFVRFYELLMKYNKEFDLTRLVKFEDIVIKHFIDSALIIKKTEVPSPLLDIGTGAGFPGIPLKILLPDTEIILSEPKHLRVKFLEMVINELHLKKIEVYPHSVTDKSFFNTAGIITRALEDAESTLTRVNHFLPEKGKVIFMKGPDADRDIASAENSSFELESDAAYNLPVIGHSRRLIVYVKKDSVFAKNYVIMKNPGESPGKVISSSDNANFKKFRKTASALTLKKPGTTIVSGKKIIKDLIKSGINPVEWILPDSYTEKDPEFADYLDAASEEKKLFQLKKSLYNELDTFKTDSPLAVIRVPEMNKFNADEMDQCILLIPFQDPSNVGAVVRSAAAFGIRKAVSLSGSANPFHAKSIRASAGTVFSIKFFSGPSIDMFDETEAGFPVVPLDSSGVPIGEFRFPDKFFLLPGVEGPGLPESLRSGSISIPLSGSVESLSAPIAASIALWEWRKRVL